MLAPVSVDPVEQRIECVGARMYSGQVVRPSTRGLVDRLGESACPALEVLEDLAAAIVERREANYCGHPEAIVPGRESRSRRPLFR